MRYGELSKSQAARCLAAAIAASALVSLAAMDTQAQTAETIKSRNLDAARNRAANNPRSEHDQALADGWPVYRTPRGQTSFNDTMAALKATESASPPAQTFVACADLECPLSLPKIAADGWIPAGRLWVAPDKYVLVAHSPRGNIRRRPTQSMRVFVFHEFLNSSRNTDTFDTISSHNSSVFVPLYMSKTMTDARGRAFVAVVQVAPYDVVSIHASNHGSAGPGVEVARNTGDAVEPLQNFAGIVLADMIKAAAPQLRVVNHRGTEGLPMLQAYERHVRARSVGALTLPFVPVQPQKLVSAAGRLEDVMLRRGQSPRIPVFERAIVPRRVAAFAEVPTPTAVPRPEVFGSDADRATAVAPMLLAPVRPAVRPSLR